MERFTWDDSDIQADEEKVNLYYCVSCNTYVYELEESVKVNSFTKCDNCKSEVYVPPNIELRDDWYIWFSHIKDYNLFHVTDEKNIASIEKHRGLYSWSYLSENNITIMKPGGNQLSHDLDKRKNLQDYVRLSFNEKSPMFYNAKKEGRIDKPVIYSVNPIAILLEGNKFSNINATDNKAIIGEDMRALFEVDYAFASKGEFKNQAEKKLIQAEVLVKTHIPISFLTKKTKILE